MKPSTTPEEVTGDSACAKPYAMVGSGQIASSIWKTGDEAAGWRYRFNLFRLSSRGPVGLRFRPADLIHFVKLIRVLAAVLADDGCLPLARRKELLRLSELLDAIARPDE